MDVDGDAGGAKAMDVERQHAAGTGNGGIQLPEGMDAGEARLRRVMGSVTGYAIKKPRQQAKKMALLGGAPPTSVVHGPGKRKLQKMKKALKRAGV
jgi:hypothetical protein